jgi:hypothetical protein
LTFLGCFLIAFLEKRIFTGWHSTKLANFLNFFFFFGICGRNTEGFQKRAYDLVGERKPVCRYHRAVVDIFVSCYSGCPKIHSSDILRGCKECSTISGPSLDLLTRSPRWSISTLTFENH